MQRFNFDIGLEIGTTNIKVYLKNKKKPIIMPSVIAIKKETREVIGIGKTAYNMLGKTPEKIEVKKTMSRGVIVEPFLNKVLIKEILSNKINKFFKKPKICMCCHSFMTNLEKLTFKNSIFNSYEENVQLIEESLASAVGLNLNFSDEETLLIVNIGGGTTDITVLHYNNIIANNSIQTGSEQIDETIKKNLAKNHNLLIGSLTAEKIKKQAATFFKPKEDLKFKIKGKDNITGLPKTLEITQKEICADINIPAEKIVQSINNTMRESVVKLTIDLEKISIILTGGGCLVPGFKELIEEKTRLKTTIAKNPIICASYGALNSSNFFVGNYSEFNFSS